MTRFAPRTESTSEDKETSCGLLNWRPSWLQPLANNKLYLFLYSLVGVVQGTTYTYLVSVLSTVERQFGIQSKESALLYSGNEISNILFVFFLPLVGRVKKRPLAMGLALALLSVTGLILIALPFFTSNSVEKARLKALKNTAQSQPLCNAAQIADLQDDEVCIGGGGNSSEDDKDWLSLWIIFFGVFLMGLGGAFYYVFGLPYSDDNSTKDQGPMLIAVIWTSRLLGPAVGYALGPACLRLYVKPWEEVDFDEDDPRWLGAWWLGFPVIAAFLLLATPWFALFPQRLAGENTDAAKMAEKEADVAGDFAHIKSPKVFFKETLTVYKRLLTIPIYVLNLMSIVFYLFGFIGWSQFQPKFLEFHFRKRASSSGFLSGMAKTISAVGGCLLSGVVASKYKFSARTMAAWCVVSGLIAASAFFSFIFMSCPRLNIVGVGADGSFSQSSCSARCECPPSSFHVVCGVDGLDYYSPCLAGCRSSSGKNYTDCECISEDDGGRPLATTGGGGRAVDGACQVDCNDMFILMLAVLFVVSFFGATTRMPNSLILLRAINPADKAASVSLILVCISLFAILPAPFVYGFIIDASCLVWNVDCQGETRNCAIYDTDLMRIAHNGFACAFMLLATLCDAGVFYLAKDLDLYDQEQADAKIANLAANGTNKECDRSSEMEMDEVDLRDETRTTSVL